MRAIIYGWACRSRLSGRSSAICAKPFAIGCVPLFSITGSAACWRSAHRPAPSRRGVFRAGASGRELSLSKRSAADRDGWVLRRCSVQPSKPHPTVPPAARAVLPAARQDVALPAAHDSRALRPAELRCAR